MSPSPMSYMIPLLSISEMSSFVVRTDKSASPELLLISLHDVVEYHDEIKDGFISFSRKRRVGGC